MSINNIIPDKLSVNKNYYVHYKKHNVCKKIKIQLQKMSHQERTYTFNFKHNNVNTYRVNFWYDAELNVYYVKSSFKKDIHNRNKYLENIIIELVYNKANVNITICENYKLIAMLIYNKYLSDNGMITNKVLSDKYLMRFIASYL
jgi:hypothetical protein